MQQVIAAANSLDEAQSQSTRGRKEGLRWKHTSAVRIRNTQRPTERRGYAESRPNPPAALEKRNAPLRGKNR
jgi:hypothetical protein